jgi:hypothetical protein
MYHPQQVNKIYSYSKTNQMHQFLKFIYFCPSSGVQGCSYSNRHVYSPEPLMMDGKNA